MKNLKLVSIAFIFLVSSCKVSSQINDNLNRNLQGEWLKTNVAKNNSNINLDTLIFSNFSNKKSVVLLNNAMPWYGVYQLKSNKSIHIKLRNHLNSEMKIRGVIVADDKLELSEIIQAKRAKDNINLFFKKQIKDYDLGR